MSATSVISALASAAALLGGIASANAAAFASRVNAGAANLAVQPVRENSETRVAPGKILLAANTARSRLEDSAASTDGGLGCKLWVEVIDGDHAIVHWESSGATALGLFPALGEDAPRPAGQVKASLDAVRLLTLVVADPAGRQIKCSVNIVPDLPALNTPLPSGGVPEIEEPETER